MAFERHDGLLFRIQQIVTIFTLHTRCILTTEDIRLKPTQQQCLCVLAVAQQSNIVAMCRKPSLFYLQIDNSIDDSEAIEMEQIHVLKQKHLWIDQNKLNGMSVFMTFRYTKCVYIWSWDNRSIRWCFSFPIGFYLSSIRNMSLRVRFDLYMWILFVQCTLYASQHNSRVFKARYHFQLYDFGSILHFKWNIFALIDLRFVRHEIFSVFGNLMSVDSYHVQWLF